MIFYSNRGDLKLQFHSQATSRPFSAVRVRHLETSCNKIAQSEWLPLRAIRSHERRKSRERAHLANAGEFNHRYLTYQDIGDFIRWSRRATHKIAITTPGTPGDFRLACHRLKGQQSRRKIHYGSVSTFAFLSQIRAPSGFEQLMSSQPLFHCEP